VKWLRTVIAGSNGDSVFIDDARQIVRMDALESERDQPNPISTSWRAVRFDIGSSR